MNFIELTEEEFKKLENKFPNSNFYQTVAWSKIKKENGWEYYYVGVKEKEKVVALSLLLSKKLIGKKKLFYAPRGFLIDYENKELLTFFTKEIKKYIKNHHGVCVKIDPLMVFHNYKNEDSKENKEIYNSLIKLGYKHFGFSKGYSSEAQFRWTYCLDVDKSLEEIYKGMDQRCRRCVRKFEKYPLTTVDVNDENISDFKNIMEHTAIRQKHYDRTLKYYQNLKKYLGSRVKMIIIYLDKEEFIKNNPDHKVNSLLEKEEKKQVPISAGVFIFDNDRCNYVYGGTYSHYMPIMAQYKLQMDMIKLTQEKNIPLYDFGGISGDFTPGSPNYGVYEFKRGFGGYVVEYIGEFDLIVNKFYYHMYNFGYFIYRKIKHILGHFRK